MNPNNPLDRHSGPSAGSGQADLRSGRNPVIKNALRSKQNQDIVPPACGIFNLKTAVDRCKPFDTPVVRATDRTTSHLTKPANNAGKVIGYQGERALTELVTTPFVLSALRSKAYRSMSGVATAVSRFNPLDSGLTGGQPVLSLPKCRNDKARVGRMSVALSAVCIMLCTFLIRPAALLFLGLTATPLVGAGELGRLFYTPEQRAQLDYSYVQGARSDSSASGNGSSSGGALTLNGIVQMHGGKRTAWINGVPQAVGSSDEKAPESMPVPLPGQNKSIKLKVGQRILLRPSSSPETSTPSSPKPVPAKPVAEDDD